MNGFVCVCTSSLNISPACDPAAGARREDATLGRQTHGSNIVIKGDCGGQLEQSDVIVVCVSVIRGVNDYRSHISTDFMGIDSLLSPPSQIHTQTGCADTETIRECEHEKKEINI